MTNLEWIRTLSEEEFADWLYDEWLHHLQYRWSSSRGGLIIWLKDRKDEPQTCSVNGRPYSKCADCEHFRCVADEPQTIIGERFPSYITENNAQVLDGWQTNPRTSITVVEDEPQTDYVLSKNSDAYRFNKRMEVEEMWLNERSGKEKKK